MTGDDRFDEALGQMARDYQRPPETPREEMWARIEAARRAAPRPGQHEVRVVPIASRRRLAPWIAAAVAASLILGIGIGRMSAPNGDGSVDSARMAALPPTGAADPAVAARPGDSAAVEEAVPDAAGAPARVAASAGTGAERPRTVAAASPGSRQRQAAAAGDTPLSYRLAAGEHLIRTEALLVSLRSDLRSGRRDSTIAVWAGDLLGTTRMLLDSPAGEDRQMKRLLEDLELVLAQIARLHQATGEAADLELIDEAVRQRQVMTRLRALSPGT